MDRTHNGPVMVGSAQGGMDIEAVAEATPDAIFTLPIDITTGAPPPGLAVKSSQISIHIRLRSQSS